MPIDIDKLDDKNIWVHFQGYFSAKLSVCGKEDLRSLHCKGGHIVYSKQFLEDKGKFYPVMPAVLSDYKSTKRAEVDELLKILEIRIKLKEQGKDHSYEAGKAVYEEIKMQRMAMKKMEMQRMAMKRLAMKEIERMEEMQKMENKRMRTQNVQTVLAPNETQPEELMCDEEHESRFVMENDFDVALEEVNKLRTVKQQTEQLESEEPATITPENVEKEAAPSSTLAESTEKALSESCAQKAMS